MPRDTVPSDSPRRRRALECAGARGDVLEELLAYGAPLVAVEQAVAVAVAAAEMPDEPQVAAWTRYADEARQMGAIAALSRVFPQLRYPIVKGISETDGYRAATRRGIPPNNDEAATGLPISRPDLVTLEIHETLSGRVPLIVASDRGDFEALVRAMSARNEPVEVPASMGACLVRGLTDWDRVRRFRKQWEASHPSTSWDVGFQELVPQRELYQVRFVILSSGPYSGLPAKESGFSEEEWLAASFTIRREHEMTHYFTLRVAGITRNNLVDELIADFVALVRTFGLYREELALRFMGLEAFPAYRHGARLENYRGNPPLSDPAFELARRLVHAAVKGLSLLDANRPASSRTENGLALLVLGLTTLGLEELALPDLLGLLPPWAVRP